MVSFARRAVGGGTVRGLVAEVRRNSFGCHLGRVCNSRMVGFLQGSGQPEQAGEAAIRTVGDLRRCKQEKQRGECIFITQPVIGAEF